MIRDFSDRAKQELLRLVDEVESEKWCDVTDWIGDRYYDLSEWLGRLDIKRYTDDLQSYHKKVIDQNNASRKTIENIFSEVASADAAYQEKLGSVRETLQSFQRLLDQMASLIMPGSGKLTGRKMYFALHSPFMEYQANLRRIQRRDVYNEDIYGQYGGDQGAPRTASEEEKDRMYEIFRKNNQDIELTSDQKDALFERLNSEGCGYVALVNTIFGYYYLREEEFEAAFGYPMYDENGNLNYNLFLMDIYSRMENRNTHGKYDPFRDYDEDNDGPKENYNVWDDSTGNGTNQYEREYYLEQFMKEHGVTVDVKTDVKVTPENYEQIVASGEQVIIAFRYGYLYNEAGERVGTIAGGHAMTVTGVTDDGRLIVSSWGGKYYIDPNETVTLTNSSGHSESTSMTFSTVVYS